MFLFGIRTQSSERKRDFFAFLVKVFFQFYFNRQTIKDMAIAVPNLNFEGHYSHSFVPYMYQRTWL